MVQAARWEATIFVSAGPDYSLRIENAFCVTGDGETRRIPGVIEHAHIGGVLSD